MTYYGKQNHECKICGQQFVLNSKQKIITDDDKDKIKKMLLEQVSLLRICRVMDVSFLYLLDFIVNLCGKKYLKDITITQPYSLTLPEKISTVESEHAKLKDINTDVKEWEFWKDMLYEIISNMDPWDVDIVELAKAYLVKIELMKNLNFRIPANALIVCAVLLRMKADVLMIEESKDDYSNNNYNYRDDEIAENGIHDEGNASLPDKLNLSDISLIPKRILKRKISAEELMDAINEALKSEKREVKRKFVERSPIEITPSIDIRKSIDDIYTKIMNFLSVSSGASSDNLEKTVKFSQISNNENVVRNFISLLFLSNDGKILLKQEELYKEIFILLRKK